MDNKIIGFEVIFILKFAPLVYYKLEGFFYL